jgi:hypothetical protein
MSSFVTADYDGRHWWILQVLDDQIQFKKKLKNGKKNALKKAQQYAAENGVEFRPCSQHSFLELLPPRPKPDQLVDEEWDIDPWDDTDDDDLLAEYEEAMLHNRADAADIHRELIERGLGGDVGAVEGDRDE